MIVFLSTADTDLLALRRARRTPPGADAAPPLPLPLPLLVPGNAAVSGDVARAGAALRAASPGEAVAVLRLHGGRQAAPDAVEVIGAVCKARGLPLIVLSADGFADPELDALSTAPAEIATLTGRYLLHGGVENARSLLVALAGAFFGAPGAPSPPLPQPADGVYRSPAAPAPSAGATSAQAQGQGAAARPRAGLLFYRAHLLSGNLDFVDALVAALDREGLEALPVFCTSLRPPPQRRAREDEAGPPPYVLQRYFLDAHGRPLIDVLISTLSFAAGSVGTAEEGGLEQATEAGGSAGAWLTRLGVPVLQALIGTDGRAAWSARAGGLRPLDVAMQVALPEFDGRLITVPVAFKETDPAPEGAVYVPDPERCTALARQAGAWARLRRTPPSQRRVAVVLGNSPSGNGRIGNGVGLDTPASLHALLHALRGAGYAVPEIPPSGDALIHRLIARGTYDPQAGQPPGGWDLASRRWDATHTPPGLPLGHVFVGLQPPRGWGDDPQRVYHDPELPPPAAYVAFYRWLRAAPPDGFGAHAVVHLGKHGTLEWLPGKAVGLSGACSPDALLGDLPLIYPFAVNDPGEGTQARRRAHAVLVGHLIPPLAPAGHDDALAAIERLLQEERAARVLDPEKLPLLRRQLLDAVRAAALDDDLGDLPDPARPDDYLARLEHYLSNLSGATVRDGLHVLGQAPEGEPRAHLLDAMTRLAPEGARPQLRLRLDRLLERTSDECGAVLAALDGRYVPAGPSGSPSRGMWNVLPTGRNFYSVDPQAIPTPAAWETGRRLADALLARYLQEHGRHPRSVGLVVWGTAAMRTHGDDVAQALALLGVRPVWRPETGRVTGVEALPLAHLGRPRVDVTVHLDGFFRDAFPHLVDLLDRAVRLVAALDEPEADNPIAAHVRRDRPHLGDRATARLFGSKPGCYGAGLLPLIDSRHWETADDLARAYEAWGAFAYGEGLHGAPAGDAFRARFGALEVALKNQDNREHDLFDSDDYFQYHGGMVAAVRAIRGAPPAAYFGDSADPLRPAVRSLHEEARRVFRTRVANPRWLAAMRRHGYKGAMELAATVDYLFGYDATAGVAADWMYETLAQRYALDPQQVAAFRRSNPWALHDVTARLLEAASRGMWEQPHPATLDALRRQYLSLEGDLEAPSTAPLAATAR